MTAEDLIKALQKFPPHFEVECYWDGMGEHEDLTAEIVGVENFALTKTISLEMGTRPLIEPK